MRPKALRLLAKAEKGLGKALVDAERAVEACEADGLDDTALETARLLVEILRESRDKLDCGRTRIVQAIADRRLRGSG